MSIRQELCWISVEDRLPEKDGSYLVCTDTSNAFITHFYATFNQWPGSSGRHISYWMPLPKPPAYRAIKDKCVKFDTVDEFGENQTCMVKDAPFRWGGLRHTFHKTAKEWADEEKEMGVPDEQNTYLQTCAYCHNPFPPDQPLYTTTVIYPNDLCQFKLFCPNCAYQIANQISKKVIEP